MSFAYEYYKRNRAILQIGGIKEEEERLEESEKGKYSTTFEGGLADEIVGFFEKAPTFNFSQNYTSEKSALVEALTQFKNMGQAFGAAADTLPGGTYLEKLMNLINQLGSGQGKEVFNQITDALSAETNLNAVPGLMRWTGQEVIEFPLKFIFLDENGGPVFFDKRIKTLLSLVTYNGIDASEQSQSAWTMRGPLGFHGTTTGIGKISLFLNQRFDRLHSLRLMKGDQKILDLHRILVIKSINVQTSEQLYLDKSRKGPAYKWITADIGFATACPIPNAFAGTKTNISNFYGINEDKDESRGEKSAKKKI